MIFRTGNHWFSTSMLVYPRAIEKMWTILSNLCDTFFRPTHLLNHQGPRGTSRFFHRSPSGPVFSYAVVAKEGIYIYILSISMLIVYGTFPGNPHIMGITLSTPWYIEYNLKYLSKYIYMIYVYICIYSCILFPGWSTPWSTAAPGRCCEERGGEKMRSPWRRKSGGNATCPATHILLILNWPSGWHPQDSQVAL